mgnify:CR=1 FL=1
MTIKFMFNFIKDQTLLYETKEETGQTPFGDLETIPVQVRKSKEYSEAVMNAVQLSISGMSYQYRGCRERLAREVYETQIGDVIFEVAYVIDTGDDKKSSVTVEIQADAFAETELEKRYIKAIELFKLKVKDIILKDFGSCNWLLDDQSQLLGAELYPRFFSVENQMREFSTKVLIAHLGYNWLEHPGLEKYKDSVISLSATFKQMVSDLANINTTMLSMTLETLSEIILKAVLYKEPTTLTTSDIRTIYQHLKNNNADAAKQAIQQKREVKVNIWDDVFSQYFLAPEDFIKQLTIFIKSRNHIAHNKLLTWSVFQQMQNELTEFESTIQSAMKLFESKNPSDELLDTWQVEHDRDFYDGEYEKQYWRDRIIGETGVEIRDEDEIYELLCQTVTELYDTLSDRYHYDPCFEVSDMETPVKDGTTKVFTVTSNASDEELSLFVSIVVDDDMDSSSYLTIEAKHGEDVVAKVECMYHNGEGHEGEEGLCVADSDSEYDDTEVHDFLEDLIEYIEEDLNPYVKQVSAMEYECGRHGGASPVADFACQECGKDGVSITEDLLPIGKCCYCGYENEHYVCELCGLVYDDMGGDGHLCNGCMPKDD